MKIIHLVSCAAIRAHNLSITSLLQAPFFAKNIHWIVKKLVQSFLSNLGNLPESREWAWLEQAGASLNHKSRDPVQCANYISSEGKYYCTADLLFSCFAYV